LARLTDSPIDEKSVVREVARPGAGAILTFAGVVRDTHAARSVRAIDYQAYRPMAESELRRVEDEVQRNWPEAAVSIAHRLGYLEVGETSVFIAVSAPHRDAGFAALRHAIDTLKVRVPIWKKEIYADGEAWLEGS
jgi:molybdopterin synthase catalytic subunit